MKDITIRRIGLAEINRLQEIGRQTFMETFSDMNTEKNMKKYLEEKFSINRLTDELNNADSQFYFAELDSNVIGYLKLNSGPSQTELKDDSAIEIERIYVLKDFHGKNAGQLLFNKAIEIAMMVKAEYVWLGVWENNHRAKSFYRKNGFTEFDKHVFRLGDSEQTDLMMKLKLK
jgi:ribosomal protein S18 acetylase RimI-like enzyme